MNASKRQILDFAKENQRVSVSFLALSGINPVTARQYLSSLAKDKELVRVAQGEYLRRQHSLPYPASPIY